MAHLPHLSLDPCGFLFSEPSGLTSDYTPLSRTSAVQNSTVKIPQVPQEDGLVHTLPEGAEGPPPSAPATAPTLHMEPTMSDLQVSDMDLPGGGPGAQTGRFGTTNLYHLDPASMASKPWRRPGADLTDWFNYGFDEASWARWATHQRQIMAEKQNIDAQAANEGFYANFDPAMGMLPGMNPEQIIATMPAPLQAQVNQQLTTLQQQMLQAQLGMMYTGGGAGAGAAPGAGTGGPRSVPPGPPPSAPPGPSPAIAGGNNAHGATGAEPYGPMPAIHIGRGPPGSAAPVLPNYGDEEWDGNPGNRQRELEPGFDDGSRARSRPPLPPPSFPGSRGGRVPRRLKGRHELDHFEGETGSGLDYSYSYDEPVPPTRDSRSQPSHRDRSQNKDERNSRRSASPNAQGPPANQREYDNSESFERRDDRAGERSTRPTRWA